MSKSKHRLHNTELDNLISNLRGEMGDIVFSWLILRRLRLNSRYLQTPDIEKDLRNPDLNLLYIITDKLENEIVARLSELSEQKIGQLNYYFAERKLDKEAELDADIKAFRKFIVKEKFLAKRNMFISHKELPEKWTDHRIIDITPANMGKCIAFALKLMIKIDKIHLGPSAIYLWREVLKKKSHPMIPLNTNFLLLPHMSLSKDIRAEIIVKEMKAGWKIWEPIKTKVNGEEQNIIVCKKWGAILSSPGKFLLFDQYPLVEVEEITVEKLSPSSIS